MRQAWLGIVVALEPSCRHLEPRQQQHGAACHPCHRGSSGSDTATRRRCSTSVRHGNRVATTARLGGGGSHQYTTVGPHHSPEQHQRARRGEITGTLV